MKASSERNFWVAAGTTAFFDVAENSRLQFFRAMERLSLGKTHGAGAGFSWYERHSTYKTYGDETRSQSEWRAFVSWKLL